MSSEAASSADGARNEEAVYTVSVAAQLVGMHAQTLRQYDRMGLVTPSRTKGRGRRYTRDDLQRLREVQRLSQDEGINLAGVQLTMRLREEIDQLRLEVNRLRVSLQSASAPTSRVFTADSEGHVRLRPPGHHEVPGSEGNPESGRFSQNQATSSAETNAKQLERHVELYVGALNPVSKPKSPSSQALVGIEELRGWQALATLVLTRRYRDHIEKVLEQRKDRGTRTL